MAHKFPPRAFTSVELLGAVVICLILGTLAVGGFQAYERRMPARYGANQLMHAFGVARTFAVSRNSNFVVNFDPANHDFWLDETDSSGAPTVRKIVQPELLDDKVEVQAIYFGATSAPLGNQVISIHFQPDGSSDDVRVHLTAIGANVQDLSQFYTVRLYGPTGLARVFEQQRL